MRYKVEVKLKKDFIRTENDKLIVGIKAKPQEGKANEELMKKLARHFKVPVSSVRIVSGRTSKRKVVEIAHR